MLVNLGQGCWMERKDGRVRLTLRGAVHLEWPEEKWKEMVEQLELPELEDGKEERVYHLADGGGLRTLCRRPITKRVLIDTGQGGTICFNCNRRRTHG